jgi:hypothetical protein
LLGAPLKLGLGRSKLDLKPDHQTAECKLSIRLFSVIVGRLDAIP